MRNLLFTGYLQILMYIYHDVLFICDYAFPPNPKMQLNPYGPKLETLQGAQYIHGIISKQPLKTVCAYNYVCDFKSWMTYFEYSINNSY